MIFSALARKSSSAKVWICLRLTPGWRSKGKVSSDQRSGRLARRMRYSKALSWRGCHCARSSRGRNSGEGRSEERRVGEEGRSRGSADHLKKKTQEPQANVE